MATTLKLVYGANTIDLYNGTTMKVLEYVPTADTTGAPTVTESARVLVWGTAATHLASERNKIIAVAQAVNLYDRSGGVSDRPYVYFQPDGMTLGYRAQLTDFVPATDPDTYFRQWASPHHTQMTLAWTRENAWESTTEGTLTLSNMHGTAITGTIYNAWEPGTYNNFLTIAGTAITGDMPARTRIELTNTHADVIQSLWIGHNYTSGTVSLIYECEDDTSTGGTAVANADCSGNEYYSFGVTNALESSVTDLSIPAATMAATKGQWVKAMLRFRDGEMVNTAMKFQLRLIYGVAVLYTTDWVSVTSTSQELLELATFRLPPFLPGYTTLSGLTMMLVAYHELGTTQTIGFDYIMLLPLDGYRRLEVSAYATPQNSKVVDDGILGYTYSDTGGTAKVANYVGVGKQIELQPGKDQRLYFLRADASHDAPVNVTSSVQVFFRERRLML